MNPFDRMASAIPQWMTQSYEDPVASIPKATGGKRRAVEPAQNRFPSNNGNAVGKETFESLGDGQDIYVEPEGQGDPHGFKSVKSVGDGSSVLGQDDGEVIKLKSIKGEEESPLSVEDEDEVLTIKSEGHEGPIRINAGGSLAFKNGICTGGTEGILGATGVITFVDCDGNPKFEMEFQDGQMISDIGEDGIELKLGDCQTETPGP